MVLLKQLVFALTFYKLIVDLDAATCRKGQKVTNDGRCDACPDGYYQPEENDSKQCKPCRKCDEKSGSYVKENCMKETNRKCECRKKFVPADDDSSTCKCNKGFGLTHDGAECSECEKGYFNTKINSRCQKWQECKSAGVKIPGTTTSDNVCNENSSINYITTPATSNKIVSLITRLTSHRPHEGAQTQTVHTTTTTSAPGRAVPPQEEVHPFPPSTTSNPIGMGLLIFGIVGLLLLTTVTCKLYITPCLQRKPAVQTRDSLCRRPVEESGDGSLSSLKLNPEEP